MDRPDPSSASTDLQADQKLIFVGGLHRSGTTHLAQLLGRHPDASLLTNTGVMMDEGQYLQDIYPQDWRLGGAGCFAFSPEASRTEQHSQGKTAELQRALLRSWAPYWNMARPLLIEKTPGNCLNTRYLQSIFETAQFVFVTRHPVAVSLATRKWSRTSLFSLMEHWLAAHEIMRRDLPFLRRAVWISYEDLADDPVGTIAQLQDFLGMRPVPIAQHGTSNGNPGYFAAWQNHYLGGLHRTIAHRGYSGKAITYPASQRALWAVRARIRRHVFLRRGLDLVWAGHEAQAVLTRHEDRVREFGYSLVDLKLRPAMRVSSRPVLLDSGSPVAVSA